MDSQPPLPISDISAPVWPRRASKACANCRRDKIRCDGARPCSGCSKKGYGVDQCIDGCDACRRARVRCENGKPCQRCRDMNIECLDDLVSPTTFRQDSSAPPPRTVRASTSDRAKLACTSCRRDNKKCDDQRPCSRCVARSEECIHVGRGPKLVKLRCEGCRKDNKRCEDARPCSHCIENQRHCVTMPRKGRGHGTRVKAACMSCRRDKIRCDGIRPCASCVRKGYECVERACKSCSREGKAAECTHRKTQDAAISDNEEFLETAHPNLQHASSSNTNHNYAHMMLPPSQAPQSHDDHLSAPMQHMYDPMNSLPYMYYPSPHVIGPGQPPPMMQTQLYATSHRSQAGYYPVIDPNIDGLASAQHTSS